MALATLKDVLAKREDARAVGAFSTYDLFSAQGVIQGAEKENLPVIVMMGAPVLAKPGNEYIAKNLVSLAEEAKVPVVVFLDHAKDYATCLKAMKLGFSAVMIDGSHFSLEENIHLTAKVVETAQHLGISVEGELGALAGLEDGEEVKNSKMTDPTKVRQFVENTGIDALAVSIGNAHGLYKGEPNLNFDTLRQCEQASPIPLVLHGGTGLTQEQFALAVQCGIKKINIGTEIKKSYIEAFVATQGQNPAAYDLIGIPQACKEAVSGVAAEKLRFFAADWAKFIN
ncbi:class II fructose-1,6-bisphosphate aldolase [Desulfotomaculum defluvii]